MIVRADMGVSFLIEFASGFPDANIEWILRGPDGLVLLHDVLVVPKDAVSVNLRVPASYNGLPVGAYSSYRDVEWSYDVGGGIVNGEARYTIEGRVPYGASAKNVRTKLGIDDPLDLPDDEISLATAYESFLSSVRLDKLALLPLSDFRIRDAIEALAALNLLPSLMVRLTSKEESGTSKFQRMDVDWDSLGASLSAQVLAGYVAVDPNYDETVGFGPIFILATPATDAFTGDSSG